MALFSRVEEAPGALLDPILVVVRCQGVGFVLSYAPLTPCDNVRE